MEIDAECMQQEVDVTQVPQMIETLEECICGDRWVTENLCVFPGCEEKSSCIRAAGFTWTPLAEPQPAGELMSSWCAGRRTARRHR